MAYNIYLTTDNVYDAVHGFLTTILGIAADKVVRAYQDNVPTPFPYPFIYMSIRQNVRNSTNMNGYQSSASTNTVKWSNILDVQIDFYGQDSMDQAQVVKGLFRDDYGVNFFEESGLVPLYADEPVMSASEDEKGNFMVRQTLTLHFNTHPQVVVPQDFFENAEIVVKNAEVL